MNHCKDCRYWNDDGVCKEGHHDYFAVPSVDTCRPVGNDDAYADITTGPEYGCVHWKLREEP